MPKVQQEQAQLSLEQEQRSKFMEIMLSGPTPGSTMNAMLQVDAIVKFVMTSEIVGLPSEHIDEGPLLKRHVRVPTVRSTH